ncbi:hypothetical protein PRIPAC_70535 [Pristionchus pacificus]|uniref:Uncharacterized protein n=1 Tax=Pristionchus pacificus TaxID=54126 RepID=A0A2A6C6R3_PRIPA|nr:hypothetical protein PRIPAC_70535 [Pristionchus pacificus]|eukprot:PDM73807.1 hypothetical protein PRIPAC_41163 [Pristionchus pacificus]
MLMDFLALTQSVRHKICSFVDGTSQLTMRELSKASKEAFDLSFLSIRKARVSCFSVYFDDRETRTDWPVIHLEFKGRKYYFAWEKCCIAVMQKKAKVEYEISTTRENPFFNNTGKKVMMSCRLTNEDLLVDIFGVCILEIYENSGERRLKIRHLEM